MRGGGGGNESDKGKKTNGHSTPFLSPAATSPLLQQLQLPLAAMLGLPLLLLGQQHASPFRSLLPVGQLHPPTRNLTRWPPQAFVSASWTRQHRPTLPLPLPPPALALCLAQLARLLRHWQRVQQSPLQNPMQIMTPVTGRKQDKQQTYRSSVTKV